MFQQIFAVPWPRTIYTIFNFESINISCENGRCGLNEIPALFVYSNISDLMNAQTIEMLKISSLVSLKRCEQMDRVRDFRAGIGIWFWLGGGLFWSIFCKFNEIAAFPQSIDDRFRKLKTFYLTIFLHGCLMKKQNRQIALNKYWLFARICRKTHNKKKQFGFRSLYTMFAFIQDAIETTPKNWNKKMLLNGTSDTNTQKTHIIFGWKDHIENRKRKSERMTTSLVLYYY